jgi:glycosyltransferase involved in cell wall biosynthesis
MKICLISPLYDPWLVGGAERYITHLGNKLAKEHDITVVTTIGNRARNLDERGSNPEITEINPRNICSLHQLITAPSVPTFKKIVWHLLDIWNPFVYVHIKEILRREQPDIVHTNGLKGFSVSLFSAIKHSSIPHIHTLHDYELISRWSTLFRGGAPISRFNHTDKMYISYMRTLSSNVDAVMSPSKFVMDRHLEHGFFKRGSKYIVPIGNEVRSNKPAKTFTYELLFIGQLEEHKGVQVAIEAFKKLEISDARFHIIGEGSYMSRLKELAKEDNRIKIYGYIKEQSYVNDLIDRCSYFIFPSIWYESFGLVINEVMARGLPVIASKIGGIPELIQNGYNGFLVQPNNVTALRSILEILMKEKSLITKLSCNAIESSKRYPFTTQVEKIMEVYNNHVKLSTKD